MHIPDAVLDPAVAATTGVVAALGFQFGLRRIERLFRDRAVALVGMTAAFIFAAQMVKFPVFPGVAGHLLGGVLCAVLLGPWVGAAVIGVVLIVQCLVFGDGGLTALGANFVNMGVIGSVVGYAIYAPVRRMIGGRRGVLIGAMVAAWISVILAAGAFAIELSLPNRWSGFPLALGWMTLVHAVIGVGEAVITGLVLRFLLLARPDLIEDAATGESFSIASRWSQLAVAGLAVSMAVAVFLGPFAWDRPDGLEYVGSQLGFLGDGAPAVIRGLVRDYRLALPGVHSMRVATALAGMVGTIVVFTVAVGLAGVFSQRVPERMPADAT